MKKKTSSYRKNQFNYEDDDEMRNAYDDEYDFEDEDDEYEDFLANEYEE